MNFKYFLCAAILVLSFNLQTNKLYAENKINYKSEIYLISEFDNKIPDNIILNEKYDGKHPELLDYAFVETRVANLRENPGTDANIIKKIGYGTRLILLNKVYFRGNHWYKVKDKKGDVGYISANITKKRTFRFQLALDKVMELDNFISTAAQSKDDLAITTSYVPNPNNANLIKDKDKYGTSADQNLLVRTEKTNEKIYIPDRSVLKILEKGPSTSKVKVLSIPDVLIVPNSKLARRKGLYNGVSKVIAIDTLNQNFMVFEKNSSNVWELISYVYTKTGITSNIGFETPKGFFTVGQVKYVMPYNDEEGQKQGSARYAIRFCGGAYIHGTPINLQEEVNREFYMKEKEKSLGTYSGTRKCIRTTENHAKFLFNWILKNPNKNSNVQSNFDNAYVIVF